MVNLLDWGGCITSTTKKFTHYTINTSHKNLDSIHNVLTIPIRI